MAHGSFAPIYSHIKEVLMSERNRPTYMVLDAIAMHADGRGLTFVGNRKLGMLTGYSEATVEASIDDLQAREWIKIITRYDEFRRVETRDIFISPYVIFVREIDFENVVVMWNETRYTQPEFYPVVDPVFNPDSYPEPDPDSYPPPPPKTVKKGQKTVGQVGQEKRQKTARSATEPAQAETAQSATKTAQSAEQNAPPIAPVPPVPTALDNEQDEQVAQIVAAHCGTRISQSRALVIQHGQDAVFNALSWIKSEQRSGASVERPFGLLKWWLEKAAIVPGDEPQPEKLESDRYTSGKYADFVES